MDHWSDYVECEWWLDESYHPSMNLITLEMSEESMLLVGKVIGRAKKGVFDISLLSHVNVDDFNERSLFNVERIEVEKETYRIPTTILFTLVLIIFGTIHH